MRTPNGSSRKKNEKFYGACTDQMLPAFPCKRFSCQQSQNRTLTEESWMGGDQHQIVFVNYSQLHLILTDGFRHALQQRCDFLDLEDGGQSQRSVDEESEKEILMNECHKLSSSHSNLILNTLPPKSIFPPKIWEILAKKKFSLIYRGLWIALWHQG